MYSIWYDSNFSTNQEIILQLRLLINFDCFTLDALTVRISVIQSCNGEKLEPLNLICSLLLYCMGVVPGGTEGTMADQLALSLPGGTDYAHLITMGTLKFSDLPTALYCAVYACILLYCMY